MAKFKKPPGPERIWVAIREGTAYWMSQSEKPEALPKSFTTAPYVPEWKKDAAEGEYKNLLYAGEEQDKKFEHALVAVKLLADAVTDAIFYEPEDEDQRNAIAQAKELAPGAWIVDRDLDETLKEVREYG